MDAAVQQCKAALAALRLEGGKLCLYHSSGYTPFKFYLTSAQVAGLLRGGEGGVLAVRTDARKPDGWWYDGGGIYRHVRFVLLPRVHLAHVSAAPEN